MGFLDDLDQTITGWGQNALKKTRDMTDTVKIQSTISNLENRKKDALTELGRIIYETFKTYGGNPNEEELHVIELLNQIEQEIEQYEKQLQVVKGVKICPNCHSEMPTNSMFCSNCGFKMPMRAENYQGAQKNMFCRNCGATLGQGQMFCTNCGTRVEENNADTPDKYSYYENSNVVENVVNSEVHEQEEILSDNGDDNLYQEECCSNIEPTCPNCGAAISEDITFCTSCGTRIK